MATPTRTTEGIYRPTGLPPEVDPYAVKQKAELDSKIAANTAKTVPNGGTAGQALVKVNSTNQHTTWATVAGAVASVNGQTGTVVLTAANVGAATTAQGAKADTAVQSVTAGTNVSVDNTDPRNPVVSASGAGATTLTGDVTGSGTGSFATTIANGAVTLAKQADVATATVFYRKTAGTGSPEVQTLATLKTDLGLSGTNTGDQTNIPGNAATATTLATTRAIYGNNFNGSAALTQIIASTYGGTGNGFTQFTGPASTAKSFALPNANATILTDNALVTGAQGGTGVNNSGKTFTIGGNFATSGAFACTLTVTATTNITLPTTGTIPAIATSGTPADLAATASLGSTGKAADAGHVHKSPGATRGTASLGADYTLTGGAAVYTDSGLAVTLPTIGTYDLYASLNLVMYTGFSAFYVRWYDVTAGSTLGDVLVCNDGVQNDRLYTLPFEVTTTTTSRVIKIYVAQVAVPTPSCKVRAGSNLRYRLATAT